MDLVENYFFRGQYVEDQGHCSMSMFQGSFLMVILVSILWFLDKTCIDGRYSEEGKYW